MIIDIVLIILKILLNVPDMILTEKLAKTVSVDGE
jgi:hypothetical protein